MAGATFNGAGSIHALLARFTKLDALGAPVVGPDSIFWTDSLITLKTSLNMSSPKAVEQTNGAGIVCLTYQAPDTISSLKIDQFDFCTPDPRALEFLAGGTIINDAATPAAAIGYAAPAVGTDPKPNGVAIELWSRAVAGGAQIGFWHWLFPLCKLNLASGFELSADNAMTPSFAGIGSENPNFGDGGLNDWTYPVSSRVYQFVQEAALPSYTNGYTSGIADA